MSYSYPIEIDGYDYSLCGKNLVSGLGYCNSNGVMLNKPPFYPLLIGIFYKFIDNLELAGSVISLISFCISIILFFKLAELIYNKKTAYLAAILFTTHRLILEFSHRAQSHSVDILLVIMAVYLAATIIKSEKIKHKNFIFLGMILACAILNRSENIILSLAMVIAIFILKKDPILKKITAFVCLIMTLIVLLFPYAYFLHRHTGNWGLTTKIGHLKYYEHLSCKDPAEAEKKRRRHVYFADFNSFKYTRENKHELLCRYRNGTILFFKRLSNLLYFGFGYIFIALAFFRKARNKYEKNYIILLLSTLAPLIIFPLGNVRYRYFLSTLPIFLLWTAKGLENLSFFMRSFLNLSKRKVICLTGFILVLLFLPTARCLIRRQTVEYYNFKMYIPEYKDMGAWMRRNIKDIKNKRVCTLADPVVFYSGGIHIKLPYDVNPNNLIESLERAKVDYLIVDHRRIPEKGEKLMFLLDEPIKYKESPFTGYGLKKIHVVETPKKIILYKLELNKNSEDIQHKTGVKTRICLPVTGSKDVLVFSGDRQSIRHDVMVNLHKSLKREDFETAAVLNSILAREAFQCAYKNLKAWEGVRDPETGLVPRLADEEKTFWNGKDAAADLFSFLLLASHYLDRGNEHLWLSTLKQERAICGAMPCKVIFRPARVEKENISEVIFGAAEYAKDGLLTVTERLGRGPWLIRLEEIAQGLIKAGYISTPSGKICSSNTEINGDMLQVLTRLYWLTNKEEYLQMAERIGEAYFFEILPKSNYFPSSDWNFEKGRPGTQHFCLRDHGSEIIPGLTELYVLEKLQNRPKAVRYREPLKKLLDLILKIDRTEDGLWFDLVDINTHEAVKNRVVDTWGYILNAYQMFDLVESSSIYHDEIRRVMRAAAARKSFPWEGNSHDGYADAIESMLYLLPWLDIPECHYWVDEEIGVMFRKQSPSGFVSKAYSDGNYIRTALLYGTYKTFGVVVDPWREDIFIGASYDKAGKGLYIYLNSNKPWKGVVKFDLPRHYTIWNLPMEFPRLNATPEWFVVEPHKKYSVVGLAKDKTLLFSGESLAQGLHVVIDKKHTSLSLKVLEDNEL